MTKDDDAWVYTDLSEVTEVRDLPPYLREFRLKSSRELSRGIHGDEGVFGLPWKAGYKPWLPSPLHKSPFRNLIPSHDEPDQDTPLRLFCL